MAKRFIYQKNLNSSLKFDILPLAVGTLAVGMGLVDAVVDS